jgi:hypothetical protein
VSTREATQNPGRATPIPRRATHVRPRVAHLPRSPRNRSLLLRSPQPRNCAGKCGRERRCPPQRWQGPRPTHPCVPARAGKGVGCVGNTFAGPCNTFPGSGNTFPGSGGTFREGASALHLAAGPADGHRKTPANDRHLTVRRRCAAETAALRTLRRRPRPGSARHTGPRNRPPFCLAAVRRDAWHHVGSPIRRRACRSPQQGTRSQPDGSARHRASATHQLPRLSAVPSRAIAGPPPRPGQHLFRYGGRGSFGSSPRYSALW